MVQKGDRIEANEQDHILKCLGRELSRVTGLGTLLGSKIHKYSGSWGNVYSITIVMKECFPVSMCSLKLLYFSLVIYKLK